MSSLIIPLHVGLFARALAIAFPILATFMALVVVSNSRRLMVPVIPVTAPLVILVTALVPLITALWVPLITALFAIRVTAPWVTLVTARLGHPRNRSWVILVTAPWVTLVTAPWVTLVLSGGAITRDIITTVLIWRFLGL